MVKDKLEELDSDDFSIRTISVNRNFVTVKYDSDLDNKDVKELIIDKLDNKEVFGVDFKSDSNPDTNDTFKLIEFRMR